MESKFLLLKSAVTEDIVISSFSVLSVLLEEFFSMFRIDSGELRITSRSEQEVLDLGEVRSLTIHLERGFTLLGKTRIECVG